MNYNKYINSFADSNEYNTYIESDNAYSPNIGFIEETKQVKWAEKVMKECIFYGTTEATTDFMIGESVSGGDSDCVKVHIILQTDGSDNIMYATKEDIVKTPVKLRSINTGITSIKKWKIDTSSVTDMSYMFDYCSSLTSLDLSSFNTSNVTDMNSMFEGCGALTSLDLSNFDTSNVTDMNYMFYDCNSLTSLDLRSFNTSNVTDMNNMFYNCNSLTSLDLSSFNTSNVTRMDSMFGYCNSLTSLDLSDFDTSNVTNMNSMFSGCNSLTSLTLSSSFFNSSAVTAFDFSGLTSWTEATSLSQFVNAISSKDGTGKTVKLSTATNNALTIEQKNNITSKGWTIA